MSGYLFLLFGVVIGAIGHGFNKLLATSIQLPYIAGFIICYGLGFLAMREGLKTVPFAIAIPGFAAGMVVVSAVIGALWFRENPTPLQYGAYAVMLAGIALLVTANLRGL